VSAPRHAVQFLPQLEHPGKRIGRRSIVGQSHANRMLTAGQGRRPSINPIHFDFKKWFLHPPTVLEPMASITP